MDTDDIVNSHEWRDFTARFKAHVLPQMQSSQMILHLWPEEPTSELLFAAQIGVSLLMDKPLVIAVMSGTKVPDRLVRAADHIVEWSPDEDGGPAALADRIAQLLQENQ